MPELFRVIVPAGRINEACAEMVAGPDCVMASPVIRVRLVATVVPSTILSVSVRVTVEPFAETILKLFVSFVSEIALPKAFSVVVSETTSEPLPDSVIGPAAIRLRFPVTEIDSIMLIFGTAALPSEMAAALNWLIVAFDRPRALEVVLPPRIKPAPSV